MIIFIHLHTELFFKKKKRLRQFKNGHDHPVFLKVALSWYSFGEKLD